MILRQPPRLPCLLVYISISLSLLTSPGEPIALVQSESKEPATILALTGDVMLGRGVAQALDGDWAAAFAEAQPWLAGADLTLANLESPLTTAPQVRPGYDLRAPPEAAAALQTGGFDLVSLANNHALDAGEAGAQETVDALLQVNIAPVVAGKLVNWSSPHQSTSYHVLAFDDSVTPLDLEAAKGAVAAAAEQGGVVIVSIHWGGEYQAAPSARQGRIARAMAEAGADVVVGHGPHVLQRIEWIEDTLVAYSLGNFLFDQPYPADCRQGAILRVTLYGGRVTAFEAIPTVTERGRVRLADPEEAAAIYRRLAPSLPMDN